MVQTDVDVASRPRSFASSSADSQFGCRIGSPGVKRMEVVKESLTVVDLWRIFCSIFLIAFVYGLESTLRPVYQPYATSAFANHSTIATVNVLRSVIAAAVYPLAAKIADVFGRFKLLTVSVVFYVLGTIIDATCNNVQGFAAGSVIHQTGYTSILLLVEVIIADITSTQSRLIFSYVPTLPFLIGTWISGIISKKVLAVTNWRWAVGMWGIAFAVASIPLFLSLRIPYNRAKKEGKFSESEYSIRKRKPLRFAQDLFWELDVVGAVLLIVIFSCLLVPFTLAGHSPDQWNEVKILVPLVTGIVGVPVWILWLKKWAVKPMMPFELIRDRAVWGALGVVFMLTMTWNLQGNFLYTILIVAFDESVESATRICALYSFCSVVTGAIVGLIVYKVRYLKPFIVPGTLLFLAAFGALYHYRGDSSQSSHVGIIGAQIFLGIAGGLFAYPTGVAIQVATNHDHVAIVTGFYLAAFNIGAAFGCAVSGAIWTQTLIPSLLKNLPAPHNSPDLAKRIFETPFLYAENYPVGTPVRDSIIASYRHTQRLLTITGMGLCILLILFGCCLRNPRLTKEQSLSDTEEKRRETKDSFWGWFMG